MRSARRLGLALILPVMLSGCVAAVIPVVAAGVLGKRQIDKGRSQKLKPIVTETASLGATGVVSPTSHEEKSDLTPPLPAPSPSERAETIIPSALITFTLDQNARRIAGESISSALLVKKVDIFKPSFVPCDDRPLAIIIDLDVSGITATLDLPVPLNADLEKLREAKVEIIWLSQRPESARSQLINQMQGAGLPLGDKDVLMLSRGRGDRKQDLRHDAGLGRCVIALMGDEKADFDELFAYLRNPDDAFALDPLWNNGWFITQQQPELKERDDGLDPR